MPPQSGRIPVQWIDDTGAGRHLSSIKHICEYFGVAPGLVRKWAHAPSEDISFYTGGGKGKRAKLALTTLSHEWGKSELRLLDDCPEVRSSGLIVAETGRARIHLPGEMPFYVRDPAHCEAKCPEWNRIYPAKVEENVPFFDDEVVYTIPGAGGGHLPLPTTAYCARGGRQLHHRHQHRPARNQCRLHFHKGQTSRVIRWHCQGRRRKRFHLRLPPQNIREKRKEKLSP